MFSLPRLSLGITAALSIACMALWTYNASLRSEVRDQEAQLEQAAADQSRLRITIAAQQRRMELMEAEAAKADAIRKHIEEQTDDQDAPDWLRDLSRRLRE